MESRRFVRAIVAALMVAAVACQLVCIEQYGWFRDELYYLACGAHPAFGYVDHPPLIGWLAWLVRNALGSSFLAVRIVSVMAGAAVIGMTARLAERLGAKGSGVVLAALGAWLAPTYLFLAHHLSMNSIEVVLWCAAALVSMDLDERSAMRKWIWLGAIVGIGLLNKHSMTFWVFATGCALLLTPRRAVLRTRGPYAAAGVSLVLVAPHLLWQVSQGFPTVEFYRNASAHKILAMAPWEFLGAQLTLAGPGSAPLWLGGLTWLLWGKRYRYLGIAYLVMLALLLALRGKAYYMLPFYPVLFAAGGAGFERIIEPLGDRVRTTMKSLSLIWTAATGVLVAPLALPILPVESSISWMRTLGLSAPRAERANVAELPQPLADMFGWENQVETLATVVRSLPPDDRQRVQIVAMNYGQASAIDWLGPAWGLPPAHSPHNSYWAWRAPVDRAGPVVIIGVRAENAHVLEQYFLQVDVAATTQCSYCMPNERDLPVFVCRGWRVEPSAAWRALQRYI